MHGFDPVPDAYTALILAQGRIVPRIMATLF